jgi:hypothetical protein
MSTVVVLHRGEGFVLAQAGSVCVAVWNTKPKVDTFEIQRIVLTEAVKARPKQVAFLCVIGEDSEPPDAEVRRRSAQMASSLRDELRGIVCVVEGEGFRAAIARTALSGMRLLAGRVAPFHVTDSVDKAVRQLLRQMLPSEDLSSLAEDVRQLRGQKQF